MKASSMPSEQIRYELWSDGSCLGNPGPGGYAAIVLNADSRSEVAVVTGRDMRTTNQKMEMLAALEGLQHTPVGAIVVVKTDSKYVVDGMTSWLRGWKKRGWRKADGSPVANLDLWQRLDRENTSRTVRWDHVRGHVGIEMNEKCDKLANEQARIAKFGEPLK